MSRFIEVLTAFLLIALLVFLPLIIAVDSADHTRVGVLSYTFTNTKEMALRF